MAAMSLARGAALARAPLAQRGAARRCRRAARPCAVATTSSADVDVDTDEEQKDAVEGPVITGNLTMSADQVTKLMTMVCEETDLAQVDVTLGGYSFHMKRKAGAGKAAAAAAAPAPAPAPAAPAPAPAAPAPAADTSNNSIFSGGDANEGLQVDTINSNKVGVMRMSNGRAPAAVELGATIKKGQVVCWVEQLGTLSPIKSEVAGEVYEILVKDLEPVEFGEPLFTIVPSFVGIKKGAGSGTGQMS